MDAVLPFLAVGVPGLILVGYAWLATRARRRGLGPTFLGPFEDMWHPAARRTEAVVQAEAEAGPTRPAPGDPQR
jgi:hypothetical protein